MAEPITPERELLRRRAFNMSCEDQHWLAEVLASNVGYKLTAESPGYDEPNLSERIKRLEQSLFGNEMAPR